MKDKLLGILRKADPKLAAVATATENGRPAIAVMEYAVRDDGTIIISTNQASHKWKNLTKNKEIALTVGWQFDRPHVQVGGDAELLAGNQAKEVSELFFAANPEAKAFESPDSGYIVITPTWCRITEFKPGGPPAVAEGTLSD